MIVSELYCGLYTLYLLSTVQNASENINIKICAWRYETVFLGIRKNCFKVQAFCR